MVKSPLVMNLFLLKHVHYTLYLGNMHNNTILGEYNTCYLFHLVIQFCEVMKHDNIRIVSLLVICLKGIIHKI